MKRIITSVVLLGAMLLLLSSCGSSEKCDWCGLYAGVKTLYNGDKVCMYCYNK